MASRYGPGVLPTAASPLGSALEGLRGGYSRQRQEAEEQERYEREQERQERLGRLIQEGRDFDRYNQVPTDEPIFEEDPTQPTPDARLYDSGTSGAADMFGEMRRSGRPRPTPEQPASAPAAFDPVQGGFALPSLTSPAPQPVGGQIDTGQGYDPVMQQTSMELSEGRHVDPDLFPDNQARARLEEEREALVQGLIAEGVPENRARLMARQPSLVNALSPQVSRTGVDDMGARTTVAGTPDQVDDYPLSGVPTGADRPLTAGQAATERHRARQTVEEEALGNAVTWIRAAHDPESGVMMDRDRILQLIRSQSGLNAGRAAVIYEQAVNQIEQIEGRMLMNEYREGRNAEGGPTTIDDIDGGGGRPTKAQRVAELKRQGVPREDARRTIEREYPGE